MAYIKNTAFEVYVTNSKRNDTQNITGKFGSFTDGTFTPDDCSAGFLCTQHSLLPNSGYESAQSFNSASGNFEKATGVKNGNSWYMVAAAGKATGLTGDHTGIYACNTYNVNRLGSGDMIINFAGKTLGLGIPADERGDFTELIVGEQYNFGAGNFTTAPTDSLPYVTIANGLLAAQATAPTDGSVYFQVMKLDGRFTEGVYDAGAKYTLRCLRSAAAAARTAALEAPTPTPRT